MKRFVLLTVAVALLTAWGWSDKASAGWGSMKGRVAHRQSQTKPWHGEYYDSAWGVPVAVVVPPKAESQTHWGWGVGATRVTPIQHQFQAAYPGGPEGRGGRNSFRPTPRWPSSTDQFGDYYIRGPW
ncbi:MAG: hypothetical protein LLG00_06375 [Planctomycetaceae bacterium]|nr:hypothetical protein [Planctomycetaceae bacterium]